MKERKGFDVGVLKVVFLIAFIAAIALIFTFWKEVSGNVIARIPSAIANVPDLLPGG